MLPENHDASGSYRCLFPARELRKRGVEAATPLYHGLAYDALLKSTGLERPMQTFELADLQQLAEIGAQVYVFHRQMESLVPKLMEILRKERDAAIVVDSDDDDLGLPGYNPAFEGTHPKNAGRNRNIFLKSLGVADAVTVTTPFLAERLSRYNRNVRVLPNYLDWQMWEEAELQYETDRKLRIGWMGKAYWHGGDLGVLRGLIGPWLEKHPEVEFVAAGDDSVHDLLGIPEEQRVSYPPVHFRDLDLASITATMDIGLVPLEMNDFNEAKSHLKGMEYAACGIPCIASPTESYKTWIEEGSNGLLAKRPKDWLKALDTLVCDDALRRAMGRAARAKASEHTIQEHVGEWEQFYRSISREADLADAAIQRGAIQKHDELKQLLDLLAERPLQTICEIGSARGGTFHALSQLAPDDALLVSIDLPGGDFGDPRGLQQVDKIKSFAKKGQQLAFLRADSHDPRTLAKLLEILQGRRLDLLFIDGDHSYDGVKQDFETYGPLADLVVFHDILPHPQAPACKVDRFWEEIKVSYPHREFIGAGDWGGLGVLFMDQVEAIAA